MDVKCDSKSFAFSVSLSELSYETEQFVNKVIEYREGQFLAVAWDNNKFIFIDHLKERIEQIIMHPKKDNYSVRCWGLELVPDFDIVKCPFAVARDNVGIILIDINQRRAYLLTELPISVNLFGHGDILKLFKTDFGETVISTVVQDVHS